MAEKYSVAIDGPSGAGKSTLAKAAAAALGICYVDTGAIYRTIGYGVYRRGIDPSDAGAVAAVLPPELLAKLLTLAGNKPVLRAVSERRATGCIRTLPDGRREQEFAYVHAGWEQLLRMDVRTRRL